MKVYKIKDNDTGLYSVGGSSPRWTKNGKVWNSIGALKNHINLLPKYINYKNWEVIEIDIIEIESIKFPFSDLIEDIRENKRQKELYWESLRQKEEATREKELFLRLKEKYDFQ